jgi:hypothetical protein
MRNLDRAVAYRSIVFMVGLLLSGTLAVAQNCTYGEARMALEKGNAVRGFVLMRMASRDGDSRAEAFLRKQDYALAPSVLKVQLPLMTSAKVNSK